MGGMHTRIGIAAALAAVVLATAATPRARQAPHTIFFDDFSGPSLNRQSWNVVVTGRTVNNEQQAYVDSPDTISQVSDEVAQGSTNGALAIRPRYRQGFTTPEGRTFDFVSGRIDTRGKIMFTYGTISARIKLTAGQGLWPAFWMLGDGPWPATGEADIMENVGEPNWTNIALHGPGYSGSTPLAIRRPFPPDNDITHWHVYAVDWTPDRLVFKIDDQPFYDVSKATVETYGRWAYDNPKYLIANFALGGQYPHGVNHADTPYSGLPAATVDLIKADKAVMFVDWIRVTQP